MLLLRSAKTLQTAFQLSKQKTVAVNFKQVRNTWCYRVEPKRQWNWEIASQVLAGIAWWWILYHFWHDFDHIVGEFDYPIAEEWTDEELGIPPDN